MATIIRVKRRLDEDPAESLVIQYKKNKSDNLQLSETNKFCLSLVTTVKSKEDTVSKQVQKALRRHHLQTSYKAHEPKPVQQTREEKRAKAKANRYKIVNSRRALADNLSDSESEQSQDTRSSDVKETVSVAAGTKQSVNGDRASGSTSEAGENSEASPSSSDNSVGQSDGATSDSDGPVVHVFDVEQDSARSPVRQPPTQSGITLNGESLISQPAPQAPEGNFVYDLYYINNNNQQYNFRDLENILSIEALHDELVNENDREAECDEVYDDDDDSNDENNWRNDYPDEDPDNSDDEFDPDMLSMEEPRSYNYRDDNFLSDAVGTRLHIFASSSSEDEEDEYGDAELGTSYEAYMKRAHKDLGEVVDVNEECD